MAIHLRQPGEPSPEAEKLASLSPAGQAAVDLMCQHHAGGPFVTSSKFTNTVSPRCFVLLGTKSSLIDSLRLACQTEDVSLFWIWQNKLAGPLHASTYQKATMMMVV